LLYTWAPMKRLSLMLIAIVCLAAGFYFFGAVRTRPRVQAQEHSGFDSTDAESSDAPTFPNVLLRDVVVSNTDPNLKNTDMFLNSEPGIAIDPTHPRKIVISAFSGAWSPLQNGGFQNAPLWYSQNGGRLWTKEFTISPPPGVPGGALGESPCDETFAFDRNGILYGTFLLNGQGEEGASCSETGVEESNELFGAVYTGATTDPSNAGAWQWLVIDGKTQPTNSLTPDQPWLIVNKNPNQPQQQNVYVAYQATPAMQVAVAQATAPPNFTMDNRSGQANTGFGGNPGHRIAADPRSGALYSLYQTTAPIQCSLGSPVSYMLNRSLDGGRTWKLNDSAVGIVAAQVCSNQNLFTYNFGAPDPRQIDGGVNSLRGGIDAVAVDPRRGDVYVVYGRFDEAAGRDRIAIVRFTARGGGSEEPGPAHFVSGPEYQSALPAVAVTDDGTVGVLYDTADGLDPETSRPFFSVHLAVSEDHGANFRTTLLQKFLFPANAPPPGFGPRPLGDYQQLKSQGQIFYGVFAGDGQAFGRPFHKIDPIFVSASAR
jgi:hypothetical protein